MWVSALREKRLPVRAPKRLFVRAAALCVVGSWLGRAPLVAGDEGAFVFVARSLPGPPSPDARERPVERAEHGRLIVREADGETRVLVDAARGIPADELLGEGVEAPVDVADPDVSFDGRHVVFAGLSPSSDAWRIFEIAVDGSGLRRLTSDERAFERSRYGEAARVLEGHDDLDPCYLPDGRVCFVSTRYPGGAPDGRVRSNNLHVVDPGDGQERRITSEKFGADTPVVEPSTGRIVYSRFWRTAPRPVTDGDPEPSIEPGSPGYEAVVHEVSARTLRGIGDEDFPGVNSWSLASMRPDGSGLRMWSGIGLDREATQAWRPSFLANGDVVALFLPVTPLLGSPRGYGLRRYRAGAERPVALGGPQEFARRDGLPSRVDFHYASAEELPDGRLLVSATPRDSFEYGIYVQENALADPVSLLDEAGVAELDAVPLRVRDLPPVLPEEFPHELSPHAPTSAAQAFGEGGSFTFRCENVFFNAPVDVDMPNAPPVGKDLAIEFYLNSQRISTDGGDAPILLESHVIDSGGRIVVDVPAGVPLFEVLRRRSGDVAVGRDGQIFHVAGSNFGVPNSTALCVGCHTGHSMLEVPDDPTFTNLAPSAVVRASSQRRFGRRNRMDFAPVNLVDRRTGEPSEEWAAEDGLDSATVDLRWTVPLSVREVVVWGTAPGDGGIGIRDQRVARVRVSAFSRGEVVFEQDIAGDPVSAGGTALSVDPEKTFDHLALTVLASDTEGLYEGRAGIALAEVEVVARVAGAPFARFVRGDANCDTLVHLTDAVVILRRLFQGGAKLCCEAASDVDEDGQIALTDAVFVLNFLFRAGLEPAEPVGVCEPAPSSPFDCAVEGCSL